MGTRFDDDDDDGGGTDGDDIGGCMIDCMGSTRIDASRFVLLRRLPVS